MTNIFSAQQRPAGQFAPPQPVNLLEQLVAAVAFSGRAANCPPRVLIDGPSGSGKSTLAKYLAKQADAQLLQMDHVYASWNGLAKAGQDIVTSVLKPLSNGEDGQIRHWDWHHDCPGALQHFRADQALIIEGSACLNRQSAPYATLRVWVEVADATARKNRALTQRPGGDIYAPYWEYWGKQERAQIAAHKPQELADIWLRPGVLAGQPLYQLLFSRVDFVRDN